MARDVLVVGRCDVCSHTAAEDEMAMDVELRVAGEGGLVDLCQDCCGTLLAVTGGFVTASHPPPPKRRGRKAAGPGTPPRTRRKEAPTTEAERTCRAEGCTEGPDGGPYVGKTVQGAAVHAYRKHGAGRAVGTAA